MVSWHVSDTDSREAVAHGRTEALARLLADESDPLAPATGILVATVAVLALYGVLVALWWLA